MPLASRGRRIFQKTRHGILLILDQYLPKAKAFIESGGLRLPFGWFASYAWVVCIFRLGGLHLPLRWFTFSVCVVFIFRLGGLHLPLWWFAPSAWRIATTSQHTDSHRCTSPPLGRHEGTWGMLQANHEPLQNPLRVPCETPRTPLRKHEKPCERFL